MSEPLAELEERAGNYASMWSMELEARLGFGKDGSVFSSSVGTAVKVFESYSRYQRERDCYLRLKETGTRVICGHHVPKMLHSDDDLLVIEMSLVRPPFLLDFASALIDQEPDFTQDILDIWQQTKQEEFDTNWGRVQVIIQQLWEICGIYMTDVHPGNISFGPE